MPVIVRSELPMNSSIEPSSATAAAEHEDAHERSGPARARAR